MNRHQRRMQSSLNKREDRVRRKAAASRGSKPDSLVIDFDDHHPEGTGVQLLVGGKPAPGFHMVAPNKMTNEEKQEFCVKMAQFLHSEQGKQSSPNAEPIDLTLDGWRAYSETVTP